MTETILNIIGILLALLIFAYLIFFLIGGIQYFF